MKLRILVIFAIALAFAVPALAQQTKKVSRIAYLTTKTESPDGTRIKAFRQGLRELGYIEDKTIAIEYWYTQGREERLPELAAELVRSKPDVIVTAGTARARALKAATATIPIVVTNAGDLVGRGVVASLARPGGNVTGMTAIAPDLSGKRIEILKEIMPRASRVAILYYPYEADELKQTETAAGLLAVQVHGQMVNESGQLPGAFAAINKVHSESLLIFSNAFTTFHRKDILEAASKLSLPTMCDGREWVEAGCLVSYSSNRLDLIRRAVSLVDKILKGRKPADLPVEQPTKFELAINLKTAKQLGITIPQTVMLRADHVIQ